MNGTQTFILSLLGVLLGGGIVSFVQFLINRHDKRKAADSAERKALRYLMLSAIEQKGLYLLHEGTATCEEKRSLRHWHDLYHNELGGNGDADELMAKVCALPLKIKN